MLDDRQAEAGAAGGAVARGVDAVEALEDAVELVGRDADAPVGDGDVDGDVVPGGRRRRPRSPRGSRRRRWPPGCRRRRRPARGCRAARVPRCRCAPARSARAAASVRLSSMARAMILSASTATGSSSGSSPCSRESSMICCTSRARRSLSVCIRPAKRCTASGSSAASMTASESSLIAPTGVFSSWLTLATKSRRIDSTRRSRVRSSTRARTSWLLSGATRAVTWRGGSPVALHEQLGLADLPVAAYLPDQLGQLAHGDLVTRARDPSRWRARRPSGRRRYRRRRGRELRSTESTAATPGGRAGSGASAGASVVRSPGTRARHHRPALLRAARRGGPGRSGSRLRSYAGFHPRLASRTGPYGTVHLRFTQRRQHFTWPP